VTHLTLQFDIEKPSTGFSMSYCLEPMTTTSLEKKEESSDVTKKEEENPTESNKDKKKSNGDRKLPEDEQVLVSLQHSLFCAKLFEAIRQEIMGDDIGDDSQSNVQHHSQQRSPQPTDAVMWLSSESEENFLPPPAVMVQPTGPSTSPGAAALCVVHCHASEVKVQLDSEYTLRAKLVEAQDQRQPKNDATNKSTGSQSPEQLLLLCRSLLLHAQEVYHKHSLQESLRAAQIVREEEEKRLQDANKPKGLDRIQKKEVRAKPKILQAVVALGTKMLFEQRIRKVLLVCTVALCVFEE
jgi:hypothetical protein